MNLFMDEAGEPLTGESFSWEELHARQKTCQQISRASQQSAMFLDICLDHLEENDFVRKEKGAYKLNTAFRDFKHATFYDLGSYDKRLG